MIDKPIMDALGIDGDTQLQVTVSGNSLIITPVNVGIGRERVETQEPPSFVPGHGECLPGTGQGGTGFLFPAPPAPVASRARMGPDTRSRLSPSPPSFVVLGRLPWDGWRGTIHHLSLALAEAHPVAYLEFPAPRSRGRFRFRRKTVAPGLARK